MWGREGVMGWGDRGGMIDGAWSDGPGRWGR